MRFIYLFIFISLVIFSFTQFFLLFYSSSLKIRFILLISGITPLIPGYYILKSFLSAERIDRYGFINNKFYIKNKNNVNEIEKTEISNIKFLKINSLKIRFLLKNGQFIDLSPGLFDFSIFNELESWYGEDIVFKEKNLSYSKLIKYKKWIKILIK